jgi:hypothetical protein
MAKHQIKQHGSGSAPGRSPAYPFIPLGRAIVRSEQLRRAIGEVEVGVDQARQCWGYGPSSSGGIQTEAALKQFGLLETNGRGESRRLKLSVLALRLAGASLDSRERHKLLERAALTPSIHRELHDRWGAALPAAEAKRFLVNEQGFNAKGAGDLIAEYEKTMAYWESAGPAGGPGSDMGQPTTADSTPPGLAPDSRNNEMRILVDGQQLSVTATVDRQGLKKLIKLLQANSALLESGDKE